MSQAVTDTDKQVKNIKRQRRENYRANMNEKLEERRSTLKLLHVCNFYIFSSTFHLAHYSAHHTAS